MYFVYLLYFYCNKIIIIPMTTIIAITIIIQVFIHGF